ncbi:MAG TPA: glycosyltransferase, partial [Tetrasphaera sp.]|uniref:glycosyltransferase family 2 protein n=1 Tax=Nostocoides sp. TaxID=1917966 RepID=UPI002B8765B9
MTAPEPLVTIIVPVYNVEAYLARCLDSLVAQTHSHLEILLVDDGSTDRSGAICDEYARDDARIRVLHRTNGGPSAARNAGLDVMTGGYVTFVDSDDWVDPRYVATLLDLLTRWDAQVAAVPFVRTTTESPARPAGPFEERGLTPDQVALEFFGANHTLWTIACSKLYAAELWRVMRFPDGRLHEDEFMTYRVIDQGARSAATTEVLYFYFQHSASITGRPPTSAQRRDAMDAAHEQVEFLRAGPGPRSHLLARAVGQFFRKQIYLRRQLVAEGHRTDADLRLQMRHTAADLWRLEPGRPFALFAQAYVRAPGVIDRAHRVVTAARSWRRGRRGEPRLRVLISSGWLGGAGGAERALHSYMQALRADEVEVVVRHVLDGPLAQTPASIKVRPYAHWRWWAAGHRDGYQGRLIQGVLNPVRRRLRRPVDVHLRALSGAGLESAVRARVTLIIPSGDQLTPDVARRYTFVAMQAPDNARLAAGGPT